MRAAVSTGSGGRRYPRRLDTRPGRLSVARPAGNGFVRGSSTSGRYAELCTARDFPVQAACLRQAAWWTGGRGVRGPGSHDGSIVPPTPLPVPRLCAVFPGGRDDGPAGRGASFVSEVPRLGRSGRGTRSATSRNGQLPSIWTPPSRQGSIRCAWEQVAALYPACSCRIDSCWPRWNQPTRRLTPPEGCFPLRAAPGLAGRGLTCLPSHLVVALRNLSAVHLLRFVAHAPALPNLRRTGQRSSARTPGHRPARPRSCAPSCSPAPRPPHSAADAWPAGAARPTGSWRG